MISERPSFPKNGSRFVFNRSFDPGCIWRRADHASSPRTVNQLCCRFREGLRAFQFNTFALSAQLQVQIFGDLLCPRGVVFFGADRAVASDEAGDASDPPQARPILQRRSLSRPLGTIADRSGSSPPSRWSMPGSRKKRASKLARSPKASAARTDCGKKTPGAGGRSPYRSFMLQSPRAVCLHHLCWQFTLCGSNNVSLLAVSPVASGVPRSENGTPPR